MKIPKPGEVWSITGGHGLTLIHAVARNNDGGVAYVTVSGHGPQTEATHHWFPASRLGSKATIDVIQREASEARARGVECNNPDCWCVPYRRIS